MMKKGSFPSSSAGGPLPCSTPKVDQKNHLSLASLCLSSINLPSTRIGREKQRWTPVSRIPRPVSAGAGRPQHSLSVSQGPTYSAQRKRSSSGPNLSRLNNSSRHSTSVQGNRSTVSGNFKDPRQLGNTEYRKEVLTKLIPFLKERNYPPQFTLDVMSLSNSISHNEFMRIFKFLCEIIIGRKLPRNENVNMKTSYPQKTANEKDEEFVRDSLKNLKYPVPLPKTLNFSAQSQISASLGIIFWMFHLAQCSDIEAASNFCDRPSLEEDIFDEIHLVHYRNFVNKQNNDEELYKNMHILAMKIHKLDEDNSIDDEIKENERLEAELENLRKEKEIMDKTEKEIQLKLNDNQKVSEFINQMSEIANNDNSQLQKVDEQLNIKMSEFKTRESELKKLQNMYENQEFSLQDMEQISVQLDIIGENIEKEKSKVNEMKKEFYECQIIAANNRSKLETACGVFNNTYRTLVESPEFCHGSFQLPDFWINPTAITEVQQNKWQNEIKPALENADLYIKEGMVQIETELYNCQEDLTNIGLEISEIKHNSDLHERDMVQHQLEHDMWKKRADYHSQEYQAEQKMLNEEALLHQSTPLNSSSELEKKVKELQKQKQAKIQEVEELKESTSKELTVMLDAAKQFMDEQREKRIQAWNVLQED